jgi:tRNA(Arg) A34 adenosine deaminase TadA
MAEKSEELMREAIRLARESAAEGGGPFGAVVVKDGEIIARGKNRVVPDIDPTAHAEVLAIRAACRELGTYDLSGCVIYASCEPCPMCLGAIHWARLDRIFYACTRDEAAAAGFDDSLFYFEAGQPLEQRRIPSEQILAEEATAVLVEWTVRADKVQY